MIKHIGFDYDGTLTDELSYSVGEFLPFYKKETGKSYSGKVDLRKIPMVERFPDCDKDLMENFNKYHWAKYTRECPFRPFVKELFEKLKQLGVTIYIVSARVPNPGQTIDEVEDLIRSRFKEAGIPVDEVHAGLSEKESVCSGNGIELLVEDDPKFFLKVADKIPVFIMDNPYNHDLRGKNLWRVYDLNPAIFIENIKYAMNHLDNWEPEYVYEDVDSSTEEDGDFSSKVEKFLKIVAVINEGIKVAEKIIYEQRKNAVEEAYRTKDSKFKSIEELDHRIYKLNRSSEDRKGREVKRFKGLFDSLSGNRVDEFYNKTELVCAFVMARRKDSMFGNYQIDIFVSPKYKKYAEYFTAAIKFIYFPDRDGFERMGKLSKDLRVMTEGVEEFMEAGLQERVNREWKEQEKQQGLEFEISKEGTICFNPPSLTKENISFVIPFRRAKEKDSFTDMLKKKLGTNTTIVRLQLLERELEKQTLTNDDELIVEAIRKKNPKHVDLTDINSTDGYIIKCEIMKFLLDYAKSHKKQKFIFDGESILMLPRDVTKKYAHHAIFVPGATEADHRMTIQSKYKKGYNPWILMEDLTEVATQIRKWKIIAGTAKKDLPTYINRQTADSDGVDIVTLLPGEAPYKPEVLESILSLDTYMLADLHLSIKDPEKTRRITNAINRTVKKNEDLLFLGDFDGKKGTGSYDLVKRFLRGLACKNIYLILGNNDPYTIEQYVKLGFLSITDKAEFQESPQRKVILTHCPYPVQRDEVNVHGHIHGSKCYWNLDWKNHYDIWDEDFVPIKIGTCLDILDRGDYKARSENHNVYK